MTAVEYALYAFFVGLAMFVVMGALNGAIASVLTSTADDPTISVPPPAGPAPCADMDDDGCDDGEGNGEGNGEGDHDDDDED